MHSERPAIKRVAIEVRNLVHNSALYIVRIAMHCTRSILADTLCGGFVLILLCLSKLRSRKFQGIG
jgi:hypothetical protein